MREIEYLDPDGAADYLSEQHNQAVTPTRIGRMLRNGELPAMCYDVSGDRYLYIHIRSIDAVRNGQPWIFCASELEVLRDETRGLDPSDGREWGFLLLGADSVVEQSLFVSSHALDEWVERRVRAAGATEPAAAEAALEEPPKIDPDWELVKRANVERWPGYRQPLYNYLEAERNAGKRRPKPSEVLARWSKSPPAGYAIVVADNLKSFTYIGEGTAPKKCNTEALKKAINRLTRTKTGR